MIFAPVHLAAIAEELVNECPGCFELSATSTLPRGLPGFAAWLDDQGWALIGPGLSKPFRLSAAHLARRRMGGSEVVRACRGKRGGLTLLDPFAGFCVDAYTLAGQGFAVDAVEHHPLIWLMSRQLTAGQEAIRLRRADGLAVLSQATTMGQRWSVVYLDPMFPQRRKSALPGLAAQLLQQVVGQTPDPDLPHCIDLGLSCADRVVLKRRLKDPRVETKQGVRAAHQVRGRAVRFDIYV